MEALKGTVLGEAGFDAMQRLLGPLCLTLCTAYGDAYEALLRAEYRGDQVDLARMLSAGRAGGA